MAYSLMEFLVETRGFLYGASYRRAYCNDLCGKRSENFDDLRGDWRSERRAFRSETVYVRKSFTNVHLNTSVDSIARGVTCVTGVLIPRSVYKRTSRLSFPRTRCVLSYSNFLFASKNPRGV